MRKYRDYKNHSTRAKIMAWSIDLAIGSIFKIISACGRAVKSSSRPASPKVPCNGKFLLIRLDHFGDLLMTTPAIRALKAGFPGASLNFLASPAARPVVENNPDIDKTYTFHVPWYDGGRAQRFSVREYLRLLRQLRQERFDVAIDFRGDIRILWLFSFLGRARLRVGYAGLGGEFLLTHPHPYDEFLHFADANLALLNRLTGANAVVQPRISIYPATDDEHRAERLLAEAGDGDRDLIVAIHPTTIPHWQLKRWAPERFAGLADALIREDGVKIVFTGGKEDLKEIERIASFMKESAPILAGKTSIAQLAALIKRCQLFISNDTGPMHIAVAVGTPLVAIFGPTDPGRSGPYGDPGLFRVIRHDVPCRRPCFVASCPRSHECMDGIAPDRVLAACRELLRLRPSRSGEKAMNPATRGSSSQPS